MFGKGLKVSVCRNGVWRKEGIDINYYKNTLKREDAMQSTSFDDVLPKNLQKPENYYTLEFTL
jgi:hypothetical protein